MSEFALKVENLSKRYRLGKQNPYAQIWNSMGSALRHIIGKRTPALSPDFQSPGHTWALKEVFFEVSPGEVVGIVGRNGAGKSTLLKILSRVTKPTLGMAEVRGRLGSLLEVGTGFHKDLTGKENIYLNATILGMSKTEINDILDDIVAFAELEKFIDTPVKYYSSGMYMRLAFSVSAHMKSDILLLDEVLAVGDASFQKKCLGKVEGVADSGRTVMFVSHDLPAILSFCTRCFLLEEGRLVMDGEPAEVITHYQEKELDGQTGIGDLSSLEHLGNGKARFTSLKIMPLNNGPEHLSPLRVGGELKIQVNVKAREEIFDANVAVIIYDMNGYRLIDVNTALKEQYLELNAGQEAQVEFVLHDLLLKPDTYQVGLWLGRKNVEDIDAIKHAGSFNVELDPENTKHFQTYPGAYQCRFSHSISQ